MNESPNAGSSQSTRHVRDKIEELRSIQRGSRNVVILVALLILAEAGVFGYALYKKYDRDFRPDRFKVDLSGRAEEMADRLIPQLRDVASEVAPTYRDQGEAWVKKMQEPLGTEFSEVLSDFPKALEHEITSELHESLKELVVRLRPKLAETFPEASQEGGVEKLATLIEAKLSEQSEPIEQHLHGLFENERKRLQDALISLEGPDSEATLGDLQKNWLHLMLEYADYELMRVGEEETAGAWLFSNQPLSLTAQRSE